MVVASLLGAFRVCRTAGRASCIAWSFLLFGGVERLALEFLQGGDGVFGCFPGGLLAVGLGAQVPEGAGVVSCFGHVLPPVSGCAILFVRAYHTRARGVLSSPFFRRLCMKRSKMHRGYSRKVFTKGAQRVHPKNALSMVSHAGPMRGGIRL